MSEFYCKYLKKEIELGLCIDINMIRSDGIKEEALGNIIKDFDKKSANENCRTCQFNPLSDSE